MATKKKETTELVKKESTELAVAGTNLAEWGDAPALSSRDTVIPRIMLCQMMSKPVINEEAKFGDLIDSVDKSNLGSFKAPLEVVPFHYAPVWIEKEWDGKEFKYKSTIPITPANDDLPFESADGQISRVRTLQFFVIDPKDLKGLPRIISFRSTSLKAGRNLSTLMYVRNKAAGLPPPAMAVKISVEKTSNDKGTFAVLHVEPTRPATPEEMNEAFKWFKAVNTKSSSIKVDNSEFDDSLEESIETTSSNTGKF